MKLTRCSTWSKFKIRRFLGADNVLITESVITSEAPYNLRAYGVVNYSRKNFAAELTKSGE
jgi:hypothetical protein